MSKVMYIEMTDERKAQWSRVCSDIIDLLRREFNGPLEAYAVVKLVADSLQEQYDIEDTFTSNERMQ